MNYIEHVEINGFLGSRDVTINFNNDINFLIGVNGSGKTTVINMIAATRAYEANLAAIKNFKSMVNKALAIAK